MPGWLEPTELRVALGCMRLSTDEDADEERGLATIAAAAEAGVTVFDTARAYGGNERLVARALRACGMAGRARVVTKGGMRRVDGAWVPDARAKAIRADCEASVAALDGLPIDLYLLHAPDPRTPWPTSLRALARLLDEGVVPRVGVANVNRRQLDVALELLPLVAVQVPLSPFDDRALRGGTVERCDDVGVAVLAHSPLGGPRRAPALRRREPFATVAAERGRPPAEVALAWLRSLSPVVVPVVGARRPESARAAALAASLGLTADERHRLPALRRRRAPGGGHDADVVVIMGIPGAGKSRLAEDYVARGYVRLNRDARGGSLRALAAALDEALAAGERRVVLDNTYLTRASRDEVVETAARHGTGVRCVWLDTPLAQAQVNVVERLLDRFGALPDAEALREAARGEGGMLAPTSQMRAVRELEPPALDEGFAAVERVDFARAAPPRPHAGVLVAAAAVRDTEWAYPEDGDRDAPHLLFDWRPGGAREELAPLARRLSADVVGPVEAAVCPHPGGPPTCWCRPPLPGLALAFARAHGVDLARSLVVGTSPAHRTLAEALGARHRAVAAVSRRRRPA